jgi:hyperosmotically inducible protein
MRQLFQRCRVVAATLVLVGLGACGQVNNGVAVPNVSDGDITQHVMTALNQSESLRGVDIQVATMNGDVRLTGVVDNQGQIDEALRIARVAEGSHSVHDELTLKK